jgi:hypothetical protein
MINKVIFSNHAYRQGTLFLEPKMLNANVTYQNMKMSGNSNEVYFPTVTNGEY